MPAPTSTSRLPDGKVLHDQPGRDRVFPQPRGMIRKETESALPDEPERQQLVDRGDGR